MQQKKRLKRSGTRNSMQAGQDVPARDQRESDEGQEKVHKLNRTAHLMSPNIDSMCE
jgi:hypothetical protein